MKFCKMFLFLLLMINDVSTNAQEVTCLLKTKENNMKMELFPDFECPVKPGYHVTFSCNGQGLILKGQREITCQSNGEWSSPFPTCDDKCGPPPQVTNADTVEMTKKEYNKGERVEYVCFNKYTLEDQPPYTKHLTCQQGQWRGDIKCLKPCTVTKEIMDERGIKSAYTDQQKIFAPHNDHITFVCQRGKTSVGIVFRQKCNDGEITLPQCV